MVKYLMTMSTRKMVGGLYNAPFASIKKNLSIVFRIFLFLVILGKKKLIIENLSLDNLYLTPNQINFLVPNQIRKVKRYSLHHGWSASIKKKKEMLCLQHFYNIFTINHMWLVVIGSNLKLTLRLLFYSNNNN